MERIVTPVNSGEYYGTELDTRQLAQQADPSCAGLSGSGGSGGNGGTPVVLIRRWFLPERPASYASASERWPTGRASCCRGGDCAESFAEHGADNIRDFFRVFLQMAVVLTFGAQQPVVKVGRIAGQFAKPRSSNVERKDDIELPSYRGDIINGIEFNEAARVPDPQRQVMAYRQSAATLNLLRAFAQRYGLTPTSTMCTNGCLVSFRTARRRSAIASWSRPGSPRQWISCVPSGLPLKRTTGCARPISSHSHEALLLGYEEALTRTDSTTGEWYGTSRSPPDLDWRSTRDNPITPISNIAVVSRTRSASAPIMRPLHGA